MTSTADAFTAEEVVQLQQTEIEAIQSILDHDYRKIEHKTWKGAAASQLHEFEVALRPDEERLKSLVVVYVIFRLPKNYPLVIPTIIVKQNDVRHKGVSANQILQLGEQLLAKSRQLLGAEMIWELLSAGQDFISNNNQAPKEAKDGLPSLSLEQEMKQRSQEQEEKLREKAAQESLRKQQAETVRSEQLAHMIEQEASKKAILLKQEKDKKRDQSYFSHQPPASPSHGIHTPLSNANMNGNSSRLETFLEPIEWNGKVTSVLRVGPCIGRTPLSTRHLAESAHDEPSELISPLESWILEYYLITSPHYAYSSGKRKVEEVEFELDKLIKVREPGLINILASAVTRISNQQGWRLSVVTERSDGIKLLDLLDQCESLPWKRVRHYLLAVLKVLDLLHNRNLLHRSVAVRTIIVESKSRVRLTDTSYVQRIKDMHKSNPINETTGQSADEQLSDAWRAPESIEQPWSYSRKRDVWDLGVCVCQMLFGLDCVIENDLPEHLIRSSREVAPHVQAFLLLMLERSSKKRATTSSLLSRLEEIILYEDTELSEDSKTRGAPSSRLANDQHSSTARQRSDSQAIGFTSPNLQRAGDGVESGNRNGPNGVTPWPFLSPAHPGPMQGFTASRYLSDFEEVEFLGKGAFGSVVKARNRLDGRFYAVKKIKLSSSPAEDERTLREISALSRLDHPHIVRYTTCWIEETRIPVNGPFPGTDSDGFTSSQTLETNTTSKTHATGPSMSAFGDSFQRPSALSRDESFRAVPDFEDDVFSSGHNSARMTGSYSDIRFANDDSDDFEDSPQRATTPFRGSLLALASPTDPSDTSDSDEEKSHSEEESQGSDDESSSDDDLQDDDFSRIHRSSHRISRTGRSSSRRADQDQPQHQVTIPVQRVLYIQMEFVENRTLREAIDRGLSEDESWRILRQMVEALAHISSLGIIHRDLKPSNVLMYANGDVKIGDFGLATNALQVADGNTGPVGTNDLAESTDLTGDLGTFLYTAPELRTKGGTKYNFKVDIYSLGIIFFEMLASQHLYKTGMERILLIRELRTETVSFPSAWPESRLEKQTVLIRQMLDHDPEHRPSPLEILKSDLLPPKMEDEYIEECLRLMANPTSAYNHQLMDALFSRTAADLVRDFTFDTGAETDRDNSLTSVVCDLIRSVARRHGAVEYSAPLIVPPNGLYSVNEKIVQMLDRTGRVVHLPYDLTVPFVRVFARSGNQRFKRYEISNVYRENVVAGGQPRAVLAASFDIVSPEKSAAAEAEALAVVEEIVDEIPGVAQEDWVIQINHETILSMILERIPSKHHAAVLGVVALLAGSKTIQSARTQLLQMGLPRSTIEELEAFNLSDEVKSVHHRLERLFPTEQCSKLSKAVGQIVDVIDTARHFGVQRPFIFTPLLALSSTLFKGGVLFTVVRSGKRRDVIAAGGRYDALLKHFSNPTAAASSTLHGVGVQMAVGKFTLGLSKHQEVHVPKLLSRNEEERSFGLFTPRRCDVYVASTPGLLRTRMEICRELWTHNIAADLQYEHAAFDTAEAAAATCRAEGILLLVFAKARSPVLKVKVVLQRAEYEVARHELIHFVQDRISKQRSVDQQVAGSTAGSLALNRFVTAGTDALSGNTRTFSTTASAPGGAAGPHHSFARTYSGHEVMPSQTIAVREREMVLPERPIERSKKGDKSQQNRPKPSSRQLVLDKASRQVSRFADHLQSGNVPILAVDFTGVNFDRLAAALTACLGSVAATLGASSAGGSGGGNSGVSGGGSSSSSSANTHVRTSGTWTDDEGTYLFRAFLEGLSADEKDYAKLIKGKALEFAFPDSSNAQVIGCGRVFLYSLREDRSALIGCGK